MKAFIIDGLLVLRIEYERELEEAIDYIDRFEGDECGISLEVPMELATAEMTGDEVH